MNMKRGFSSKKNKDKLSSDGVLRFQLVILRRTYASDAPRWQTFVCETDDMHATVATILQQINRDPDLRDLNGEKADPVRWECSCLQKKCGACAMVINGHPALACDTFLKDSIVKGSITLEPLRKFPVVADLIVDRSIMLENLKTMQVWANAAAQFDKSTRDTAYEGSRCLQCGCCLEVCPNFAPGIDFFGAASFVPTARLLRSLPAEEQERLKAAYQKHVYAGCGKSLACADVCPQGIDMDHILSTSAAFSVWKRK